MRGNGRGVQYGEEALKQGGGEGGPGGHPGGGGSFHFQVRPRRGSLFLALCCGQSPESAPPLRCHQRSHAS